MDWPVEGETIWSLSWGKTRETSRALIDCPSVFKNTEILKVLLTVKAPAEGPTESVAHFASVPKKRNKKAVILVANELEPLPLQNFMLFDCYVNTACPRLADDTDELGKPCLNYDQLLEVFKILDELS